MLDQWLSDLAEAGITDLFLETFYHGLATNDSDVFRDRFAHDELADTIVAAHSYGMRVHAWLETGYWGFGTSADYILERQPGVAGDADVTGHASRWETTRRRSSSTSRIRACSRSWPSMSRSSPMSPGLEGIHIDYHRYPVDNATTPDSPAPYSYDVYTMSAVHAGGLRLPAAHRARAGRSRLGRLGAVPPGRHLELRAGHVRRDQRRRARARCSPRPSSPPPPPAPSQLSKMQDWPAWANGGYMEVIIPMAYGPTQSSIRSRPQSCAGAGAERRRSSPGSRSRAPPRTRPSPRSSTRSRRPASTGFVFFEGGYLAQTPAELASLRSWIDANAPAQPGDC
jgi:hypothetical protein